MEKREKINRRTIEKIVMKRDRQNKRMETLKKRGKYFRWVEDDEGKN
jgi:hypothetical protein